ncbi:hypothetical protein Aperf_G00000053728 [Anoplocephala perfoliata]
MYFPPISTPSRREPMVTTNSIQKILDDNVHLIHNIMNNQKAGSSGHDMQELQLLHKNLIYLATIADQATNNAAPPPPPAGPLGPPVPPQQQQRGGPPAPQQPPTGFPPPPEQHPYPPPPQSQSRGQPMPPNYMAPPPVGPGPMMPPQHQHPNMPPQQSSQPGPPLDDRVFMQQQRVGQMPPYGYPAGPPPPLQAAPPPSITPQQPPFSMPLAGEYGAPRYENVAPSMGGMPPGIDPSTGIPEPQLAPPGPASISSAPTPSALDSGLILQQQNQVQPPPPLPAAAPSPKPPMVGADKQQLGDEQIPQQQPEPIPPAPSSTSSN